jgi:hypothetical protein
MKSAFLALSAALALTACGGGGGESKSLFSLWERDGNGSQLDLSSAQFGSDNEVNFYTQDGTRCICDLAIIGDQGGGTLAVTGCISIPYNASKNPQCVALQGSGSYSKSDGTLSITRNGSTSTFH